jgi:hypothetical protein
MKRKTDKQKELDALKTRFLDYFKQLPVQKLAAASVGKSEDTVTRWKQDDAAFADQIEQLKAQWALENVKGVKSREWLLERLMKDHFAPRQELTGKDGKDLPTPILGGITNVHTDDSDTQAAETKEKN